MATRTSQQPRPAEVDDRERVTVDSGVDFASRVGNESTALTNTDYDLEDMDSGFEETSASDFKLPWLRPLQKGSPEVDPDSPKLMEGAKAGFFLNTATNELVDGRKGFRFVAVHRTHQFVEFVPRAQGGGFVAAFQPDDPAVVSALSKAGKSFGKVPFGDGNELSETFLMYGLYEHSADEWRPVVLPFASSGIDAYKTIMTKLDMLRVSVPGRSEKVRLPMFATRLHIHTEFAENKKGSWYKIRADYEAGNAEKARLGKEHPLYLQAKRFRELVTSNRATVDFETSGANEEVGTADLGNDNKGAF
jgi:hypothetical protein